MKIAYNYAAYAPDAHEGRYVSWRQPEIRTDTDHHRVIEWWCKGTPPLPPWIKVRSTEARARLDARDAIVNTTSFLRNRAIVTLSGRLAAIPGETVIDREESRWESLPRIVPERLGPLELLRLYPLHSRAGEALIARWPVKGPAWLTTPAQIRRVRATALRTEAAVWVPVEKIVLLDGLYPKPAKIDAYVERFERHVPTPPLLGTRKHLRVHAFLSAFTIETENGAARLRAAVKAGLRFVPLVERR